MFIRHTVFIIYFFIFNLDTFFQKDQLRMCISMGDLLKLETFQTIVGALIIQQCTEFEISIDNQEFNFSQSKQQGCMIVNGKECKI